MTRTEYCNAFRPSLQVLETYCSGLFDLDRRNAFELLADRLGLVLGRVLLERLRCSIHQILGFLQAQRRNFAYSLDGIDLIGAKVLQDYLELGLLLNHR